MAYEQIPFDQEVSSGTTLKFRVSFFDYLYLIRPTENELASSANNAPGCEIVSVNYVALSAGNIAGNTTDVIVKTTEDITPQEISQGIKANWTSDFKTVTGVNVSDVQEDKFSVGEGLSSLIPKVPVTSSIALIAIAVILIVLFAQFGKSSHTIRIR